MIPEWAGQYVGLPWKDKGRDRDGVDCWGACYLVWREQYGRDVPSFTEVYATAEDAEAIAAVVALELSSWEPVDRAQVRDGDAVLLRIVGLPVHVGVMLDGDAFLHAVPGIGTVKSHLDSARWERRFLGCWRHRSW